MGIRELENYPEELQPIIKAIFDNEKELTYGYLFFDGADGDETLEKDAINYMTNLARMILSTVKKQLENQYPLWRFENGQFIKVDET